MNLWQRLKQWFTQPPPDPGVIGRWEVYVTHDDQEHLLGDAFDGTHEEAIGTARGRAELYFANRVFKTGDVAFGHYGVRPAEKKEP